jgi:hypothetical protein
VAGKAKTPWFYLERALDVRLIPCSISPDNYISQVKLRQIKTLYGNLRKMNGSVSRWNASIYIRKESSNLKTALFSATFIYILWCFALPGTCVPSEEQKQKGS